MGEYKNNENINCYTTLESLLLQGEAAAGVSQCHSYNSTTVWHSIVSELSRAEASCFRPSLPDIDDSMHSFMPLKTEAVNPPTANDLLSMTLHCCICTIIIYNTAVT